MYIHIFLFRWKSHATAEHRVTAAREIGDFAGAIPGLLNVAVGPNLSPNRSEWDFGGCMTFVDAASYNAYAAHSLHLNLLEWLVPLIDAIELDLPGAG